MSDENENRIYTSSKGAVLKLRPISQFKLDSIQASRKQISPPTYTVKPVAGPEQEFPLDEEVATSRGRLDEWVEYVKKRDAVDADFSKRFTSAVIWYGVDVEPSDEWITDATFLGTLPENKIAKKVQYVYDTFLETTEDMGNLLSDILEISQINQEVVERLRANFRTGKGRKTHSGMAAQKVPVEVEEPII